MRAIEMVMAVAPVAAALLIFSIASRLGLDVLASLSTYLMTIIVGLAILVFVAYPVVIATVGGRSPGTFFRSARVVVLTALATSSSSATLPMTVKATEHDLRVPREIAAFVVPLGATIHMNGTALATAVTVLFVAQVYGFDLTLAQHLSVALMSVVAAMSAGSVPGGAAPLVTMMLGMVGAPLEGIALVLGVERVLDMLRTSVDVTGDMVAATVVHRFAGVNEGTTI
jgi:DAACS family dicarboxylate/amino acid:cation (Na+ or H+) symporter